MLDKSRFDSLAVMIDCSRNAVMTVDEVKKFMKLLSQFGYNRFMLYTEDTYEIEGEEFFGYFRGRYTESEIKEMDDFAFENGIELVPCLQTLAHFTATVRWKKYADMVDIDDTLLVDDERTYALVEKIISTARKYFRTDKIHIGMDEANLGKGKYRDIHGEKDRNEIFLSHIKKVCDICRKYDFKPMMWSDMFYIVSGSGAADDDFQVTASDIVKEFLPDDITLVYWNYFKIAEEFHHRMMSGHKLITDKVAYAGGVYKWSSFVPSNRLGIESNRVAFESCARNGVRDAIITLWGDNGAESSPLSALPALAYIGCMAQGIYDKEEIEKIFKNVTGCDFDDFMLIDLPDRGEGLPVNYMINPCKYQFYNDCFMGLYDKGGVYEGDGARYAEMAVKLADAAERMNDFKYLFDTAAKLCNVLEIKAEIGIRSREVYRSGDKTALETLIKDYEEMIERTKVFYKAFKYQWFKENKPNGFEVHDIRFGGLIMRMQSCHDRLVDLRNGTITSIPELEEEILPLIEKKERVTQWAKIVTPNLL